MNTARLGHVRIEKIEGRTLRDAVLGRTGWRWRTVHIRNGQVGVWSESYRAESDCDASIHAHQAYMATAPIKRIPAA